MSFQKTGWGRVVATAVIALGIAGATAEVRADEVEDFYSGNLLTILIGHPPGGSFDLYAQLAARHLGKHIPGHPDVVVQGMPGGGGSIAAAHFANKSPRDGSVIALIPESLAHTQLLEPEKSRWDVSEMRYIGRIADVTSVMAVRQGAPAQTFEEMLTTPTNVSCSGRTTSSGQSGAVLRSLLGAKFNLVCGYDSATASILAVFRGEADATSTVWTNWSVNYEQQLEAGEIKPVVQFGLKRLPDLSDVPTAMELTDDPAKKQALALFGAGGDLGRALLAPPEMPDDRFNALAEAFTAMMNDPEFLADAESKGIPLGYASAAEMKEILDGIFATPPEVVELLKVSIEQGFDG